MLNRRKGQAGDTLIEVLFAITVFSLVVVSSLAIMNQGTATSQRALEITLVTEQIDNQVEVLRFLHESYVTNYQSGYATSSGLDISGPTGQFYDIVHSIDPTTTQASVFNDGAAECSAPPSESFVLNTRNATVVTDPNIFELTDTFAQLQFESETSSTLTRSRGVWIEAVRSPVVGGSTNGFIDFHVRACWNAPGLSVTSNLGTIVRLYEPRG